MMLDHLKNNGKVKAYKTHSAHILQQEQKKKKVEFFFKEKKSLHGHLKNKTPKKGP